MNCRESWKDPTIRARRIAAIRAVLQRPETRRKMRVGCTADLFWSKVKRCDGKGCWEWQGASDTHGYGKFRAVPRPASPHLAHRYAWEYVHGPIPAGLNVLHKCDNPRCVRPSHLFLGDQLDNIADMVAKGRQRGRNQQGACNGNARLTVEDVKLIRELRSSGVSTRLVAERFSVSVGLVYKIHVREVWQNI